MSWTDSIKAVAIISVSTIMSFFIVEYSYRNIIHEYLNKDFVHRIMLFELGNNFRNHDDYFKYFPNEEIRSTTLYSKSKPTSIDDLVIEYDYIIHTNNFGLVMRRDVLPNERAIFVIGDSFTEGQGASPWFYELEDSYDVTKPKILNLGILGTGPQQWKNLASSTSKELGLDVVATVVNIIPGDMDRNVWTFKERELNCLYRALCYYVYGFQGYKFVPEESNDDIKRAVLNRLINSKNVTNSSDLSFGTIKDILKQSRVIVDLYRYFYIDKSSYVLSNEASLLALREAVSGKIYVNVVSQKNISSSNYANNNNAKRLIDFLHGNQIKYKWCDIPVDGFHKNDGHPNANGYKILRECTRDALDELDSAIQ